MDSTAVNLIISKLEQLGGASASVFSSTIWPLLVRRQFLMNSVTLGFGIFALIAGPILLFQGFKKKAAAGEYKGDGWVAAIIAGAVLMFIGLIMVPCSITGVICPECEALASLLRVVKKD